MKSKAQIVLRALQQGQQVDLGYQYPITLGQGSHGNTLLCFVYSEECNPPCDITVGGFIDACEKLSDAKVTLIAADITLTEINRRPG